MFRLIRIIAPIVAVLCSVNVLFHYHSLEFLKPLKRRSWVLPWLIALVAALANLYFMLDTFSTAWMTLFHLSGVLVICDIISLLFRLFGKSRKPYTLWRWLVKRGLAFFLAAAVAAFGLININHVCQTDYLITTDKPIGEIKIALISDTHLGNAMDAERFESVLNRAFSADADIVILAGDLTDEGTETSEFEKMCESLKNAKAPLGTYFVFGNHDGGHYGGSLSDSKMEAMLTEAGVNVLTDESVLINGSIRIVGRRDANDRKRLSPEELLADADENEFVIMVDHQPAETQKNADAGVDLLLSGHTHNGQI